MAKTTQNYDWTVPEASDPADVTVLSDAIESVDETIKGLMDGLKTQMLEAIYPIGSIYTSVNKVSPANFLGGTWERIQDTFLLAAGSTYSAGTTGGEATHTLTQTEMPNHNHSSFYVNVDRASGTVATRIPAGGKASNLTELKDGTASVGGGQAHNNMPPYLAVYVWKRTA